MATTTTGAGDTSTPSSPALRANRPFRLLWIGQALSDFGSSMTSVALPLVLLAAGYSATAAATLGTVMLVVGLVVRVPAGYAADRYDQRTLMLACDLLRLVAVGSVALCLLVRPLPLPLALGAVVVTAATLEVFRPAQNKVVRRIVPADLLPSALSLNQARTYGAAITAPAVAGLLLALRPAAPFAVDAVTFGVSALCVALAVRRSTPAPAPEGAGQQDRFLVRLTAGWRHLVRDRFLRWSAVYFTGLNLAFAALSYALVLGAGHGRGGAMAVGAAMSSAALAGLLGSLIAPQAQRRLPMPVILAAGPAIGALLLTLAWFSASTVAFAAGFSALCLLTPVIGATYSAVMATSVPEEIYGRVTTASSFVSQLLQPLGPLAAGVLLARLPLSGTAAVLAVVLAVLAVLALTLPAPTQPTQPAQPAHPA